MKDKPETRPLTTLEFFILGLIHFAQVTTTYDLRRNAGLSWGGIHPSLVRLKRWKLLSRHPRGERRKRAFRLTKKGEQKLNNFLEWPRDPAADLETVIRAAWLTLQLDPSRALDFVHGAMKDRRRAAEQVPETVIADQPTPLQQFEEMRLFCTRRKLQSEAGILEEVLQQMEANRAKS